MTKITAAITTSVEGYVAGPNDGPGQGLGEGGERLHYWVFGGPWTYEQEPKGEPTGEDAAWLSETFGRVGAVVAGRTTYEASGRWGTRTHSACPSSSSPTGPRRNRRAATSRSSPVYEKPSNALLGRPARRR